MNRRCLTAAIAVVLLAGPAAAQPAAPDAALDARLASVDRSIERVADLLDRLVEQQYVELLLKRVELKERRVAPLRARQGELEDRMASIQDEIARLKSMRDRAEDDLRQALQQGVDPAQTEARQLLDELEPILAIEEKQLEDTRLLLIRAEDDVARNQEELSRIEEHVLDLLEQLAP